MNVAIVNIAKQCRFDAAAYTWVQVRQPDITGADMEEMKALLVAHGDYATPLKAADVRHPFENIALVIGLPLESGVEDGHLVATYDCKDSLLETITLWGFDGEREVTPDPRLMTLHFRAKKEMHALVPDPPERLNPKNKPKEELCLISISPLLDEKLKDHLINYIVPMLNKASHYMACMSEGLLTGNTLEYYRPTASTNNAKRIRKGKTPLYEWRTVTLERKRYGLPSAPKGGTHASPRLHQRRGHWAVSKLGKKYWRRETVVGNPDNGMIFHDYTTKENQDARH